MRDDAYLDEPGVAVSRNIYEFFQLLDCTAGALGRCAATRLEQLDQVSGERIGSSIRGRERVACQNDLALQTQRVKHRGVELYRVTDGSPRQVNSELRREAGHARCRVLLHLRTDRG